MKFTGTIVTYFLTRNFGFIRSDADNHERFFHRTSYSGGEPEVGIKVEFEIGPPTRLGKAPQCVHIKPFENLEPTVRVEQASDIALAAHKLAAQEGGQGGAQ